MNRWRCFSFLEPDLPKLFRPIIRGCADNNSTDLRKADPKYFATEGTMTAVKKTLMKRCGARKAYTQELTTASKEHLRKYLVTKQNELPERTMNDSFASAVIPLSSDLKLRDRYVTITGSVRSGRLLEDMDTFAVHVGYLHIYNPRVPVGEQSPYMILTAHIDRIEFTSFVPKSNKDIRLSGRVSWVGKSSMEVTVWVEQHSLENIQRITKALYLMVTQDIIDEKSTPVNSLRTTNAKEREILEGGTKRQERRKLLSTQLLTKVIPTELEQKLMHDLFIHTIGDDQNTLSDRILPPKSTWMRKYRLSSVLVSHPENRNVHNKVFGGFIIQKAMELSWPLAVMYCRHQPTLRVISDIVFYKPIDVNSLIQLQACVVYSKLHYFQITVYVSFWSSINAIKTAANVFHFTFESPNVVDIIYPFTYRESVMYIDGYRQFNQIARDDTLSK